MTMHGGIDLGGTKIQAVVVDDSHNVIGSARTQTPKEDGPAGVASAMAAALRAAASDAKVDLADLSGAGVGSPGSVDESAGTVASATNVLADWRKAYPLGDELRRLIGAPVAIANDVSVATDAEFHLGAGRPYRSILGVFWGTGVGGGLVLDGKSWVGRGAAGELGHIVIRRAGARCTCGRRGCLEAYAGRLAMELRARAMVEHGARTALFDIMHDRGRDRLTSGVWQHALGRDDQVAVRLIDRAVRALGAGVASAINLLDLEAVVIGGGMGVRLGAMYAPRISDAMHPHLFVPDRPPAVHVAELGDLGGAIGAALHSLTRDARNGKGGA
jgi:glucokinase